MPQLVLDIGKKFFTSGRCLFSHTPRMTLRQAFNALSATLPVAATVDFFQTSTGIAPWINPIPGRDEPLLTYEFFSGHNSVEIRRIHAGGMKGKGIGKALIASQLPFWEAMGARHIFAHAHRGSAGFYLRLGFTAVNHLPEYPHIRNDPYLMRLDLHDPVQKATLMTALRKGEKKQESLSAGDPAKLGLPPMVFNS